MRQEEEEKRRNGGQDHMMGGGRGAYRAQTHVASHALALSFFPGLPRRLLQVLRIERAQSEEAAAYNRPLFAARDPSP